MKIHIEYFSKSVPFGPVPHLSVVLLPTRFTWLTTGRPTWESNVIENSFLFNISHSKGLFINHVTQHSKGHSQQAHTFSPSQTQPMPLSISVPATYGYVLTYRGIFANGITPEKWPSIQQEIMSGISDGQVSKGGISWDEIRQRLKDKGMGSIADVDKKQKEGLTHNRGDDSVYKTNTTGTYSEFDVIK